MIAALSLLNTGGARRTCRTGLLCVLVMLAGGCQVQMGRGQSKDADSTKAAPVPVETETLSLGSMASRLHLNGVLGTEAEIKVFPLVAGHVGRIRVEEGSRVRAGDTLLVLEDAEILLSERRLRLELDKAESDLSRVRQLADSRMVPEQDLADADYTARRARLSWESARLAVQRSRVTAPISGVVGRRLVQEGDFVATGTQLFTVVDDQRLIAVLDVPERELDRLRLKQPVELEVGAAADGPRQGWIKRISPVVDAASGTVRVTIGVEDPARRLRAGMYARFNILTDTRDSVVVVPKRALVYDRDQTYVWVARDSLAARLLVQRGYEDEERVEARSGVKVGEQLITVGQAGLKPDSRIRVVKADGRATPAATEAVSEAASK
jgi:membrane fusion protein (multidrug efflux system)